MDNPRVCGKDLEIQIASASWPGSPPRVRERQRLKPKQGCETRISPACVGKTWVQLKVKHLMTFLMVLQTDLSLLVMDLPQIAVNSFS